MQRRVKEGLSKREVIRILKRYVAREVYRYLAANSSNRGPPMFVSVHLRCYNCCYRAYRVNKVRARTCYLTCPFKWRRWDSNPRTS
jgi:hypothetical protein